jgi:hypothetical protein
LDTKTLEIDVINLGPRIVEAGPVLFDEGKTRLADLDPEFARTPVLVRASDMTLIDGLKRVLWHVDHDITMIDAVVTDDFVDCVEYLEKINEGITLSTKRMGQLYVALYPMSMSHAVRLRRTAQWRREHKIESSSYGIGRVMFQRAFNAQSTAYVERLSALMRSVMKGDPEALEILAEVERGEITVGGAVRKLRRRPFFSGNVDDRAGQLHVLEVGARSLNSTTTGLMKLRSPLRFTAAEAENFITELEKARRSITSIIRKLKEEMNQGT